MADGIFLTAASGGSQQKVDAREVDHGGGDTRQRQVAANHAGSVAAPTFATVGATSGSAVSANSNRAGLILVNVSTAGQRISLHLNNGTAVLDSGITLWPGGHWDMPDRMYTAAQINAIASAASAKLAIQESSRT